MQIFMFMKINHEMDIEKAILLAILPLILGAVLDLILGDPYSLPHPIRLIGTMIGKLDQRLRKGNPKQKRMAGGKMAFIVLAVSTLIPFGILWVAYKMNTWCGVLVESVFCYYMLAATCLRRESMKVYDSLRVNDVEGARRAVSMIVGRDTEKLDMEGITKAAVETVAENTSDGVTAPLFYMALAGAVGGFFYKAANTMDSMVGYQNEKYQDFGFFPAKLDDVLNYLPSRISALCMIAGAFFLGFNGKHACAIWRRDRRKHASPNSAQTESVCAGALEVQLAGNASYFGVIHEKPFIGDPIREIQPRDIVRANRLMYATAALNLLLAMAVRALLCTVWYACIFR